MADRLSLEKGGSLLIWHGPKGYDDREVEQTLSPPAAAVVLVALPAGRRLV